MTDRGGAETERVSAIYDRQAPLYDRAIAIFEWLLVRGGREWVCSQARGSVLEIAIGTGRNLPLYAPDVELTGIDISPRMLERARRRADALGRTVELRVGDAQALAFPDASFDTVVVTLGLCVVPDDRRAVAEVHRVLRPGGRFLLLEHVCSPLAAVGAVQALLDPLADRFQGDHLTREPLGHLLAEGFEIERLERSKLGIVERVAARKKP